MPKGGYRPGAGRPKGSISEATKEKIRVEAAHQKRILGVVDRLFNSQLALAEGVMHLFRIEETGEGRNKRREHVLVTDPDEIKRFLDETDGVAGVVDGGEYYYISTKSPDNKAIDSMLDRVFGKAAQKQPLDDDGEPLPPMTVNVLNAPTDELLKLLTAASANSARGRRRPAQAGRRT